MRLLFVIALSGVLMAVSLQAQSTNTGKVTSTNAASSGSVNSTNKPDIKELMTMPAFTNGVGMAMVKISDSLWVGKYEVTQKQYQGAAAGGSADDNEASGDQYPVDSVSWSDAMNYCGKLSDRESKAQMLPDGFVYTLPTQAQWESLAANVSLADAVTSSDVSRSGPSPVGSLGPSGQGLYDIRGNLWEWCLDPEDEPFRVARGAAWNTSFEVNLRVEFRWYAPPDERKNTIGFRCVLTQK